MAIHGQCKHQNIVEVIESGDDGIIQKPDGSKMTGLYYMVMDYVPAGMLFDVCSHFEGVGEVVAKCLYKQILDGMQYIHDKNIAHLDMKLENIMVDS